MAEGEQQPDTEPRFQLEHPDRDQQAAQLVTAAIATRREGVSALGAQDVPGLIALAKTHDRPVRLAVAKSLLARPDLTDHRDAIETLAVSAVADDGALTGEQRNALIALLEGAEAGEWIKRSPTAPRDPRQWRRSHFTIADTRPLSAVLDPVAPQSGFTMAQLTIGPVQPISECSGPGSDVVVGTPSFACDFDKVAQRLDPAHWPTYISAFKGSAQLGVGYEPVGTAGGWRGGLYERFKFVGDLTIENVLTIDYTISGSPGAREARAQYQLDTSLDGQVSVDDGALLVAETSLNDVFVVFAKRIVGDVVVTSYCAKMEQFLKAGLSELAKCEF